ncbi:MAG: ZIP family metal transporter [Planctomycetota bacterium]
MLTTLVIYCCLIALSSALGGSLPAVLKLTHRRTQFILSFVSGVMLGVALLNLLPHSILILENPVMAMATCLSGLLFMFFMVRAFHFHQHDLQAADTDDEFCGHEPHPDRQQGSQPDLTWAGLSFGLAIHTLIDGVTLATAVNTAYDSTSWAPAGVAVFLAILLHKPLDALSITSLMSAKGWSPSIQMTVNVVFAVVCPLSALLFTFGTNQMDFASKEIFLGYALAFSAGIFLCISLGDLLPEVHFHSNDRVSLSAILLFGIVTAFVIEMTHSHELDSAQSTEHVAASTPFPQELLDR